MKSAPFLSKSKYLSGLQCAKLLWYSYNAKDKFPPIDQSTQALFDQGHLVGNLARSLFPGGLEVGGTGRDFRTALQSTQKLLPARRPLFEPAFGYRNAFARADILNPVGAKEWDIIEVKSSTSVKDVNLRDLAIQKYTYQGAGLQIRNCILMHINNEYVRKGEIDIQTLFTRADVTPEVNALLPEVEPDVDRMVTVIGQGVSPDVPIGAHCSDPYECPLIYLCWAFLPEDNPTTLYRIRKEKAFDLIQDGRTSITDLPAGMEFSDNQSIQIESARTGQPHVDKAALREFLAKIEYPVYYLDFETVGTAIPLYDDVSPFQQVPFQFSLHVAEKPGGKLTHYSFLAAGRSDPREEFLKTLRPLLGDHGSVIAYNASFEIGKLNDLAELFPSSRVWCDQIKTRTVDLLEPFRSFSYYHPAQRGSASIKNVLPALTGSGYENMPIAEGGQASNEFLRITFGDVSEDERRDVRRQLEEYCSLDTMAMWRIVGELRTLVE